MLSEGGSAGPARSPPPLPLPSPPASRRAELPGEFGFHGNEEKPSGGQVAWQFPSLVLAAKPRLLSRSPRSTTHSGSAPLRFTPVVVLPIRLLLFLSLSRGNVNDGEPSPASPLNAETRCLRGAALKGERRGVLSVGGRWVLAARSAPRRQR